MNSIKVIATYFGRRRKVPVNAIQAYDMLHYVIDKELEVDAGYPMDTLFVISEPDLTDKYTWNCYCLINNLNGTSTKNGRILVMLRKNLGLSFGAYNDAFMKYENDYKYWLFTEDDHIMIKNNYVGKAVEQFEADENIGFVSTVLIQRNRGMYYLAGGIGLTSAEILRKVADDPWHLGPPCELHNNKCLPHPTITGYDNHWIGEIGFSHAVFRLGYKFVDLDMEDMCIAWGRANKRSPRMARYTKDIGTVITTDNVARELPAKMTKPSKPNAGRSCNYIIASWLGSRRDEYDGIKTLEKHLEVLSRLKHSLTQITIVVPHYSEEKDDDIKWIMSWDSKFSCPLVVLRRKNIGLSYGSYSYAYGLYRKAFDYYIFMEDDYIPVRNNFDRDLIELYEEEDCAYLCGFNTLGMPGRHGRNISNGIAHSSILEQIWEHFGDLPHGPEAGHYHPSHQISFINAFTITNKKVGDYSKRFRSPFWESSKKKIVEYGPEQTEFIIKPIQLLENK